MFSPQYFDFPVPLSSSNCPPHVSIQSARPPAQCRTSHGRRCVHTHVVLHWLLIRFCPIWGAKLMASFYQTLLLFFPFPLPAKSSLPLSLLHYHVYRPSFTFVFPLKSAICWTFLFSLSFSLHPLLSHLR